MSAIEIYQKFIKELSGTTLLEFVAVVAGIVSVWFSKKENIWVYPTGLINTVAFVYISIKGQLFGEASVNIFYTIMSIYGWILWAKKDQQNQQVLVIKYSSVKEWLQHLLCFAAFYIAIYTALTYLQNREFAPHAMPAADAFASASAYTGMSLMARKKVESWLWWINKHRIHPVVFCERVCLYQFPVYSPVGHGLYGVGSMAQKSKICKGLKR